MEVSLERRFERWYHYFEGKRCTMTFETLIENFSTRGLLATDIQRYLNAGGDINRRDSRTGWALLHFAAENRDRDIIKLLVACEADLKATARDGWTPLHVAADSDLDTSGRDGQRAVDLPTVRLLVELGADETARTIDGLTARDIARDYGQESLYDSLLRRKAA